jgi:hypothetical protein
MIRVSNYAGTRPGPGVKPIRTGKPPVIPRGKPFGQEHGINRFTGKHIPLSPKKEKVPDPTLDALTDTNLDQDSTDSEPRPADGDMLVYDATTGYWKAAEAVDLAADDPGDSVVTLGAEAEGGETPLLTTWTAGGTQGLVKWGVARVVYDHEGNKVVYEMLRKETYDKYGRLYSVDIEKRVVVDTAEAC